MAQFDWFLYLGDIVQYPMIEISKMAFDENMFSSQNVTRDGRLVPLIETNQSRQKVLSCVFLECSRVAYILKLLFTSGSVNSDE